MRISKLTDYATVILARLAAQPGRRCTAAQIALETHLAPPTVSKLLKQLHRQGLVASTRGPAGGYLLARPAAEISAVHILDAMEGPVALTECSSAESQCGIEHTCLVAGPWQRINLAVRRSLQEITLLELAGLAVGPRHAAAMEGVVPVTLGSLGAPGALDARSPKREPL